MTFEEAHKKLGGIPSRKVGPNTFLTYEGLDTIGVLFYSKLVVMIHRDGSFTLNSWEKMTKTTSKRIMAFAPVRLKTRLGDTTITACCGGAKCEFVDGIRVNQYGEEINAQS